METRIREIRAERGWTVRRLAEESGVDKNTISDVERGKRKPNPITMHKLAEALGVEVRNLFPLGQAPLPDFEDERRDAGLESWVFLVKMLTDRWGKEIDEREAEWQAADSTTKRHVKMLPNLHWANEIRSSAADVTIVACEELEMGLGVYTSKAALQLFSVLHRLNEVTRRTDPWFSSTGSTQHMAKVIDIRERLERMEQKIGARAS